VYSNIRLVHVLYCGHFTVYLNISNSSTFSMLSDFMNVQVSFAVTHTYVMAII